MSVASLTPEKAAQCCFHRVPAGLCDTSESSDFSHGRHTKAWQQGFRASAQATRLRPAGRIKSPNVPVNDGRPMAACAMGIVRYLTNKVRNVSLPVIGWCFGYLLRN